MFPRLFARAAVLLAGVTSLGTACLRAEVTLHRLFTDHAVLQRGQPVPVWGWAAPGEAVTVEFAGQKHSTTATADGRWRVTLRRLRASAQPAELRVTGNNTVTRRDILVGEVWVCSGQSNMEWRMAQSFEPERDIQSSANPQLRLFTVVKKKSAAPLADFAEPAKHAWAVAGPESVRDFSAVAYYFGRDLAAALGVPVGLIHTSWGGSPAEAWMRADFLAAQPYAPAVRKIWEQPKASWQTSELYNGMIAPLLPAAVAGAIWYQGESNAGRAWQYRDLFADMIRNWRADFGRPELPFFAVQLAPWDKNRKRPLGEITAQPGDSDWAELREAQNHVARVLPKVGVAVITDAGDKDDIHPARKQPAGERLARLARRAVYGQRLVAQGPVLRSARFRGGAVTLGFTEVGAGLTVAGGGDLTGFAVAGTDGKWHWAKAELKGRDRVVLTAPAVPRPRLVRYGWADFPVVNLANSEGLPASPFRTDSLPAITLGK
jgi:sialate O-acetylesterase